MSLRDWTDIIIQGNLKFLRSATSLSFFHWSKIETTWILYNLMKRDIQALLFISPFL